MAAFLRMDYPNDKEKNINYDGRMHMILPLKLQRLVIKGCELFLLNYVDMSLGGKSMITLLVREDANFYKVPLIKYDSSFNELVSLFTSNGRKVELNMLPFRIETKAPVNLSTFLQQLGRKTSIPPVQTKKRRIIYFDPSTRKYYWDKKCTSEIKGAPDSLGNKYESIIYGNGDTDYVIEVLERVAMAIPIYYNEADGNYYYDPDCKNRIPNTSGFPKNPKEGDKIHAGDNYFYVVHRVSVRRDNLAFDNPPRRPSFSEGGFAPNSSGNVRSAFSIPIYYNKADGNYYYDSNCTRRFLDASRFPKNPNEGEKVHAGANYFYEVHRVNVNKYNYTRKSNSSSGQDIYYDDVTNSFYYDSELRNKVERILELDMYLFLNRIPKEGEIIFGNNNQTKFIIHRVEKKKIVQPIYYDEKTNNFYYDRECSHILTNILQLDIYQLAHPIPNNGDLIHVSESLSLRINVVTKNKSK